MKKLYLFLVMFVFISVANAAGKTGSAIAEPIYTGPVNVKGDMGWDSRGFKLSHHYSDVLLAHKLCRDAFAGSRAALYDDFKYIYSSLPSGKKFWLLDPFENKYAEKEFMLKDGSIKVTGHVDNNFVCNGWTSYSSADEGTVFNTGNGSIGYVGCNSTDVSLACVSEQ